MASIASVTDHYESALKAIDHRPYALPTGPWRLRQRWNDLLFAHWPIPAPEMAALLPAGLEVDTFDGYAWAGVVPFWMDDVHSRIVGDLSASVPSTRAFLELNLRTYVRSPRTGRRGVFFFSLDCASPLAVAGARVLFHLPYFFASMQRRETSEGTAYRSRRRFAARDARFDATYAPISGSAPAAPSEPGSLEHFLTERYCLFTPSAGRILVGDIHHGPWPLQPGEAEIRVNEIPAAHGITLPNRPPVLHFSRELYVSIWPLHPDVA